MVRSRSKYHGKLIVNIMVSPVSILKSVTNSPLFSLTVVIQGWGENDRGVSFTFGGDVVRQFLRRHDLDLVVRAHQVVEDGYEFFAGRELVTVFSAPNYCGEFDNAGAMMTVDDTLMCSFQILKPASATQQRYGGGRSGTPGRR